MVVLETRWSRVRAMWYRWFIVQFFFSEDSEEWYAVDEGDEVRVTDSCVDICELRSLRTTKSKR